MIINYNVSGSDRKRLVAAIAEHTGEKAKYLGAPSFAHQVGSNIISVDGKVTIEDNRTATDLIRFLWDKGFHAEDPLADCIAEETDDDPTASSESEGICISIPRSLFTELNLANLRNLISAKHDLICTALGVTELPIEITDTKVSFPWFPGMPTPEDLNAYDTFICKLCETARNQKRIHPDRKTVENEKYAFRCFLLKLGFIGEEYKQARKILLRNFTGDASYKGGKRKAVEV